MKALFYIRYAVRSLVRSGQRSVLAILCVAFGVMSLVSLQLLANMVRDAVIVDPRIAQGGDAQIWTVGNRLSAPTNSDLDQMRVEGIIDRYTLYSESIGLILKPHDSLDTPGSQTSSRSSAPLYFLNRAQGVDPHTYPLVGTLELRGGGSLLSALSRVGDAVISRDLVDKARLHQGDTFTLGSYNGDKPISLRVAGVAEKMPDNQGDTILYSLETAQKFAGRTNVINYGAILLGPNGAGLSNSRCADDGALPGFAGTTAERVLCGGSWGFQAAPAAVDRRIVNVFDLMLRGAGLLGLLVGGIGVANTLQVLLARRSLELATLKALGYNSGELVLLIGVETALLGLVGSILGALAAVALSFPFMNLFARTGTILMDWHLDAQALFSGMLAGNATAIIFGLVASVRAGAVRPASLLRNATEAQPRSSRAAVAGLWVLLAILFGVISSLILSSPLYGAGVVAVVVLGFAGLGGILGGALAGLVRVPLPGRSIWSLAQHNLKRQAVRAIFSLIALFAGTFSIGFAASIILSAQSRMAARQPHVTDNLVVYGSAADAPNIAQQLAAQTVTSTRSNLLLAVETYNAGNDLLPITQIEGLNDPTLDPRIQNLTGAPWGTQQGLYLDVIFRADYIGDVPSPETGDYITLKTPEGEETLPIIGFFERASSSQENYLFSSDPLILADDDLLEVLGGGAATAMFVAQVPEEKLQSISADLSRSLPGALVFTSADVTGASLRTLLNLFTFVVAIASLALLAGAVLIANSVGLALVERRRELGILKAVGYSSRHLLSTLLIEHALLGLLGGAAGVCATFAAISIINQNQPAAKLGLDLLPAAVIVVMSTLLAMVSTALVARHPTRMRPAEVLRGE